jgi:hypothetical protein
MWRRTVIILLSALGCKPAGTEDTAYLLYEPDLASIDSRQIAQLVEENITDLRSLSAKAIVSSYLEKMEGMDEVCPIWNQEAGQPYWYDTCTSQSGVEFSGYGTQTPFDGTPDAAGNQWTGTQIYSLAELKDSTGSLKTNGSASYLAGVNSEGFDIFFSHMDAGFSLEDGSAWHQETPKLTMFGVWAPDIGYNAVGMNGVASIGDGMLLSFTDLQTQTYGENCSPEEPGGMVSIYLPESGWIDLMLDGPGENHSPAEACDGCARAYHKGVQLDDVCFDLSDLLDWTQTPFE